jgi:COP9 signalosome complex subunit 8
MRLPDRTKEQPLAQALFSLLASIWERRYEHIYVRAQALYSQAKAPGFPDAALATVVSSLIEAFVGAFHHPYSWMTIQCA